MKKLVSTQPKRFIIANWKMNPKTPKEAITLYKSIKKSLPKKPLHEIAVLVPYPYYTLLDQYKDKTLPVGVQNIHHESSGAHTGEVALDMFTKTPPYVLVGHSECRARGETDEMINKKIILLQKTKSKIILCVGEKTRDHGILFLGTIREQLEQALRGIQKVTIGRICIAYEPIWAIGKNAKRSATPEEVHEVAIFIKKVLVDLCGQSVLDSTKILYGGSVDQTTIAPFLKDGGVDGFLIGRASLDPKQFISIISKCS